MFTIDALLEALTLEPDGPDRYRAANVPSDHGVVFGGQLLGQAITAGLAGQDGKVVKTISTIFARSARPDLPLEIVVDRIHGGRVFSSSTVTISQGDRLCTRSLVLLTTPEDDLIRHAIAPSRRLDPADAVPIAADGDDWQVRIVDGVDIVDPDAVGPAELDVWTRFVGAPHDPAIGQALLAYATDGFLIGTAMRPHPGIGQAMAHVTLSTGVVDHTLTFHEEIDANDWMLLSHTSPYAGHGRTYGRADVFRADGQLLASFVQDAMVRAMPENETRAL